MSRFYVFELRGYAIPERPGARGGGRFRLPVPVFSVLDRLDNHRELQRFHPHYHRGVEGARSSAEQACARLNERWEEQVAA